MVSAQLQRLQKDSEQLDNFIRELTSQGDVEKAARISQKKNYLDTRIAEICMV